METAHLSRRTARHRLPSRRHGLALQEYRVRAIQIVLEGETVASRDQRRSGLSLTRRYGAHDTTTTDSSLLTFDNGATCYQLDDARETQSPPGFVADAPRI
jgi:hypothetical protein